MTLLKLVKPCHLLQTELAHFMKVAKYGNDHSIVITPNKGIFHVLNMMWALCEHVHSVSSLLSTQLMQSNKTVPQ